MSEWHTPSHGHGMPMPCDIGKGNAKARQCKGNGKHVRDEVEETYKVDRGLADFDRRFGLDRFDPEFVRDLGEQMREQARHVARGPERLAAYLAAPPEVQADFDRRQAAAYYAETEAQRLADDTCTTRQFEAWLVEADDG